MSPYSGSVSRSDYSIVSSSTGGLVPAILPVESFGISVHACMKAGLVHACLNFLHLAFLQVMSFISSTVSLLRPVADQERLEVKNENGQGKTSGA